MQPGLHFRDGNAAHMLYLPQHRAARVNSMCLQVLGSQELFLNGYEIKMAVITTVLPKQMCQPETSNRFVQGGRRMLLEVRVRERKIAAPLTKLLPHPSLSPVPAREERE